MNTLANRIEARKALTLREAIEHPDYAYARAGDRIMRNDTLIYHWERESPSGVHLAFTAPKTEAEPLIRELRSNSPLSPSEGRQRQAQ
jgi:hypothetical protein